MSFSATGLHARRFKTARNVFALVMREMVTTYGRSPGGYVWAVLEPIGGIAVLSIAFSFILNDPALGNSFPLFYATGFLPFMMYNELAMKIGQSLKFSKPLLTYPAISYTDAIIARFLLNAITHVLVFYIIAGVLLNLSDTHAVISIGPIVNAFGMALTLGLGVGTLNCFLLTRFPVWERIWAILNRPLFLVSGIFFIYEMLPKGFSEYIKLNPLIHIVGEMRRGFYPNYEAAYVDALYVYLIGLAALIAGLILLNRYHRDLMRLF